MAGYHIKDIKKGELGEASKIREELEEFEDALSQNCNIMALHELSDLVGAIQAFLDKHHPSIGFFDLTMMAQVTKRAFEEGDR